MITWRSEPAPESLVLVTVNVVASAEPGNAHRNSAAALATTALAPNRDLTEAIIRTPLDGSAAHGARSGARGTGRSRLVELRHNGRDDVRVELRARDAAQLLAGLLG